MNKFIGQERRRRDSDRRQSPRAGKFDRRKNTCLGCHFFKQTTIKTGQCQKHQTEVQGSDYACVWFTAKITPE